MSHSFTMRLLAVVVVMSASLDAAPCAADEPQESVSAERVLFDFEADDAVAAWSNLTPALIKSAKPPVAEPAAKAERSTEHVTHGKHSLKITFQGGQWPAITTTEVPADWQAYNTFVADVTVDRPCVVGFRALQEKSSRDQGWDETVSRWVRTQHCVRGRNEIVGVLHPPNEYALSKRYGSVIRFEITMYDPHEGESIYVDHIRLLTKKTTQDRPVAEFRVLGTDLTVSGVAELGKKLKDQWQKPEAMTVTQAEQAFAATYNELKKNYPQAVLVILRDGQKGYDPAQPDKVFAGWRDAYWSSHGPDGMLIDRAENFGKSATQEVFMRHRSPLMRVNLSSIPRRATILAAQLLVVRAAKFEAEQGPHRPNMWVAEPCTRPWDEYEVNAYRYARDKYWREIGGWGYGIDPDFEPVYLAHGPGREGVNVWDFTEAVRYWTDGKHENHGFMLHGDSHDWFRAWYREAEVVSNRPAVLVVYEPQ